MLTFADFKTALASLELEKEPAIAHVSLRAFGAIQGGAETVLGALLDSLDGLMVPAFTYKTMVVPEVGPPNNGLRYGTQTDLNSMAQPFSENMPCDPLIGVFPEFVRHHPSTNRTTHPILSFSGINVNEALATQTTFNPFAPIGALADQNGWVLLLGVNHISNTSIHYAEKLAGRHQFVRWAFGKKRIIECPGFPGCSEGFEAIRPEIERISRRVKVGESFIEAIGIHPLLQVVETRIKEDPLALLCQKSQCDRCDTVRDVAGK
jgi:aminoglycoside 3-N-acetyltransferase